MTTIATATLQAIRLQFASETPLPQTFLGSKFHGALMQTLQTHAPAIFEMLHGTNINAWTLHHHTPDAHTLNASLNTLTPRLDGVWHALLSALPTTLEVDGITLKRQAITLENTLDVQDLYRRCFEAPAESLPTSWRIEALSPTTFKSAGMKASLPLPVPELMLGNALRRWARLFPEWELVPADKDVLGFVLQDLRFSLERLNGEGVYSQGSHYPCFTGRFRWSISRRGIGSVNHRLIAFMLGWMQVAGTGTKTAMGFGQLEVTIV